MAVRVECAPRDERCRGILPDQSELPIVLEPAGNWRIEGLLVVSAPIEAYLKESVAELGAPQTVRCEPAVRIVAAGDRIECQLEHGGLAFATIAADGSFEVEVALDRASGSARSLAIPDDELVKQSTSLETDEAEEHE